MQLGSGSIAGIVLAVLTVPTLNSQTPAQVSPPAITGSRTSSSPLSRSPSARRSS
jgi:hypothetical protein